MASIRNVPSRGGRFTQQEILQVWLKGRIVAGYDPSKIRKDACEAWMSFDDYGKTDSHYGWEVDHIFPRSLGGDDTIRNLQPLQWENNRSKGDSIRQVSCKVTSRVNQNIDLL